MNSVGRNPAQVRFCGVHKYFDRVLAVEGFDLDISEGSLVTLLGPSGCGKTTLLRMLAGLETPSGGDIYIKGVRVNDVPVHKRNLGVIFQNYALFPHKTVFENVAFGLKYRNLSKARIRERVSRALESVRLPDVDNRMPSQLSGGQQQRIALARAVVIEPDVLLMDEPLSALDENLREEMRREIESLQRQIDVTTIFVTHDQREALSLSDKIVVMNEGRKQQEGTPETVYNHPANRFVAGFLGHSNFLDAKVERMEDGLTLVKLENGRLLRAESSEWSGGDPVEVVIRAQKVDIGVETAPFDASANNIFRGRIKERSYMGGEVSYFVEITEGDVLHVITVLRDAPLRVGDEVTLGVDPRFCRLLPKQDPHQSF